jgi:hypothetical protein
MLWSLVTVVISHSHGVSFGSCGISDGYWGIGRGWALKVRITLDSDYIEYIAEQLLSKIVLYTNVSNYVR